MTDRGQFFRAFNTLLQPERFRDFGPNGLQVEGSAQVTKIVPGVTASQALIEAAIEARADAIFVNYGLFWRGQDGCVTGWMRQRLGLLLAVTMNLFACLLPLDAHPELGNNAQLGRKPGLTPRNGPEGRFGEQGFGFLGAVQIDGSFNAAPALAMHIKKLSKRPVALVRNVKLAITKIALCTGDAQRYFESAVAAGAKA